MTMFESIRRHWAQARADVVSKQVEDILQRYERMNPNDKYWVFSPFEHMLSEVEDQHGALAEWNAERKSQIAKQIMHSAQKAFSARGDNMSAETTRLGANGGALLSCYLELQTLPGDQADKVVVTIEGWREDETTAGSLTGDNSARSFPLAGNGYCAGDTRISASLRGHFAPNHRSPLGRGLLLANVRILAKSQMPS
jgi:hypothetical protein